MKFKYYDLLSQLVPGYLLYQILVLTVDKLPKIEILPSIAIAYLIGFFINSIASWIEPFYEFTWNGKPSDNLLNGKTFRQFRFSKIEDLKDRIKSDTGSEELSNKQLFDYASSIAYSSNNERIKDFNSVYAFSRALLTTMIIASIPIFMSFFNEVIAYAIYLPSLIICWHRTKERGYYYAKEVLLTYQQVRITTS